MYVSPKLKPVSFQFPLDPFGFSYSKWSINIRSHSQSSDNEFESKPSEEVFALTNCIRCIYAPHVSALARTLSKAILMNSLIKLLPCKLHSSRFPLSLSKHLFAPFLYQHLPFLCLLAPFASSQVSYITWMGLCQSLDMQISINSASLQWNCTAVEELQLFTVVVNTSNTQFSPIRISIGVALGNVQICLTPWTALDASESTRIQTLLLLCSRALMLSCSYGLMLSCSCTLMFSFTLAPCFAFCLWLSIFYFTCSLFVCFQAGIFHSNAVGESSIKP